MSNSLDTDSRSSILAGSVLGHIPQPAQPAQKLKMISQCHGRSTFSLLPFKVLSCSTKLQSRLASGLTQSLPFVSLGLLTSSKHQLLCRPIPLSESLIKERMRAMSSLRHPYQKALIFQQWLVSIFFYVQKYFHSVFLHFKLIIYTKKFLYSIQNVFLYGNFSRTLEPKSSYVSTTDY